MKISFSEAPFEMSSGLFVYTLLTEVFWVTALSSSSSTMRVRVNIPQYRVPGEIATLHCEYDLGNNTLYSVKWYKEHEEFYRFVLRERPQANWYKVEGVHVDMSRSDSKKVVLHSVDWKTSGIFRCEVSAEAPSFASAQGEARMEVIALPKEDPVITGVEEDYRIGEEINLNCTSGRSHPAPLLQWYVNEQKIQKPEALIHYHPHRHPKGLLSSTLGLRFKLSNQHFRGGSMKVKCIASIAPVLYQSDREKVLQKQDSVVDEMREALLLVRSSEGTNLCSYASVMVTTLLIQLCKVWLSND